MTLIIEDGTGVTGADSYVTLDEFKEYADAHGLDYESFDDDELEQAIRRGTRFIDGNYASQWLGRRTHGRDQRLAWPRTGVIDGDGDAIPVDEIPWEVKYASIESSHRELTDPGSLLPDYGESAVVEETVGPITVKYDAPKRGDRPIRPVIDDLLVSLLLSGGGNSRVGYATFLRA
jgi:hypothetical protein